MLALAPHLEPLCQMKGIRGLMLFDSHGCLLYSSTATPDTASIGALAAGAMAACHAMGQLFGQKPFAFFHHEAEDFQLVMHVISKDAFALLLADVELAPGFLRFELRKVQTFLLDYVGALKRAQSDLSSPLQSVSDEELEALLALG